jgi:hypothetical protein
MITPAATVAIKRKLGDGFRYYRLLFNLISTITLAPVLWYEWSLHGRPLFQWEGPWNAARIALLALVALLGLGGARHYDLLKFLGLRGAISGVGGMSDPRRSVVEGTNVDGAGSEHKAGGREKAAPVGTLSVSGGLNREGIHRVTRHPWYLAALIVIWLRELSAPAIVSNTLLSAYLIAGTLLEERKLRAEFGLEYEDYSDEVSMLVPFKYIGAKIRSARG